MSDLIIVCPECETQLKIPNKDGVSFKCTNCEKELSYSEKTVVGAKHIETNEENKFQPSTWRIGLFTIIGAIIGAPIGAMAVSCVAALVGSVTGLFNDFVNTWVNNSFLDFLLQSIENIGNGAANLSCSWTSYGAKYGPYLFGGIGFFAAFDKDFLKADPNETYDPEKEEKE